MFYFQYNFDSFPTSPLRIRSAEDSLIAEEVMILLIQHYPSIRVESYRCCLSTAVKLIEYDGGSRLKANIILLRSKCWRSFSPLLAFED
ncbi:hypothetical protein COP2_027324 [Malus domestica]